MQCVLNTKNKLHSLQLKQLRLFYQPIVSLDALGILGWEALLRWEHPKRGLLLPRDFIPDAELSGDIVSAGEWAITEACHRLKHWQTEMASAKNWFVSVNLAPMQIEQSSLSNHVQEVLATSRLAPKHLKLEVTESNAIDTQFAKKQLQELRSLGIQICLDDFGKGYSALNYLCQLPLDILKLDRHFLWHIRGQEAKTWQVIKSVLGLARGLHLSTVVEGVETREQLETLRRINCPAAQGYFFSRPLPEEAVPDFRIQPLAA
ncbi:MAG: EAL domain-containing protein [Cyanobacteria bacterium P01_H01_bin.15]